MPSVSYLANGFCKETDKVGEYRGFSELRFWNPTERATTVRMTVYYSDKPPARLPDLEIKALRNPLLVIPRDDYTEFFKDCGAWGMKIVSDTVLMLDHIMSTGRQGPPDNVKFAGGCNDILAKTRLSRLWYFADGLRLVWEPETAPFPFNEFEWYHILNPGKRDAHVTMNCYYGDGTRETYEYEVGAERVLMIDNYEMVKPNNAFGIKFVSDLPVVVESERYIYGLHSMEEWGATNHCPRPGLPAPLEWNEETLVE